ncbi:helix-turn-helix transcriptional regulator [Azotobacter vinelandii]|uniref:helix-turn-helix transcriptional regulator n=2 Tax=Azotobacter vinelandii TaxID=354 RepID=UPI00349ECB70
MKTDRLRLMNPDGSLSRIVQVREVAQLLNCKEAAVRYLLHKGRLPRPAVVIGKTMLWPRDQIEAFAAVWRATKPERDTGRTLEDCPTGTSTEAE